MDEIFKALNDPARRALLDALRMQDGQTLGELETVLDMTRFGVMKHLKVLETANLIIPRKVGRFKHHYLNPLPLQDLMDRWAAPFLQRQARGLSELKIRLERLTPMEKPKFMMQTYIRCTQEALWNALTDPDAFQHYDFLEQTAKRNGDTVTYRMPDGTETLHARDLEVVPMTKLVTSFEPTWAPDATPSRITYEITVEGDFCCLTVLHEDLNNDPSDGTGDGWVRSIAGLKTYLETGRPAHFGGAYLMEQM